MRIYLLIFLIFNSVLSFAQKRTAREIKMDSMSGYIEKRIENLDSTMRRLDRLMDSITGKQTEKIDTMALYQSMMERMAQEQRQKDMLFIQIGGMALAVIAALAAWRWRRKKKDRKATNTHS